MTTRATIFAYCERGLDPAFWAEPLNALTSIAFLAVAALALRSWRAQPALEREAFTIGLIGLVAAVGVGSFLFHTLADRWSRLADVAPIGVFMLAYLAFALARFVGLDRGTVAVAITAFAGSVLLAGSIRCGGAACLNGSLGYAPALLALAAVGGVLAQRSHPAAQSLLAAAALLGLSLVLRTLDQALCPWTILAGHRVGTHVLWHVLNAGVLALLLGAAIRHGRARGSRPAPAARP